MHLDIPDRDAKNKLSRTANRSKAGAWLPLGLPQPGMLRIVIPSPVSALFPRQNPEVVELITRTGNNRMVAVRNQHGVAILHDICFIDGYRRVRSAVDSLHAK